MAHMSCIELSIVSVKHYKTIGIDNSLHKALASLSSEKHIFLSIFPHVFSWEEYIRTHILVKNNV
jgi:hypothetical protein